MRCCGSDNSSAALFIHLCLEKCIHFEWAAVVRVQQHPFFMFPQLESCFNSSCLCMQLNSILTSCSYLLGTCWRCWKMHQIPTWKNYRWKISKNVVAFLIDCCWLLSAYRLSDYLAAYSWLLISIWVQWLVELWYWWMLMSFDKHSALQITQSCRIPAK